MSQRTLAMVENEYLEKPKGRKIVSVKTKSRKFYILRDPARANPAGWKLMNSDALLAAGLPLLANTRDSLNRSFCEYPVLPRFYVSRRLGRKLADFQKNGYFWIISDRARQVLLSISEIDFSFLATEVEVDPDQEPLTLWLCDVLPVLDAVDESRSEVSVGRSTSGKRIHYIGGLSKLFFDEAIVNGHHAFRLETNSDFVIVDDVFREAFKRAGLKGLSFRCASKP
ncbi:MAG: DUF1629 domain-containing protein [Acetobacter sp.]|uniref:imm11 family protein n=1 Tax=Acetobacter sp. TaxID=440 RepID=UPI0039EC3367